MKTLFKTTISFFLFFAFLSCKKESGSNSVKAQSNSSVNVDDASSCNAKWFGTYTSGDYPNPSDTVLDNTFITNGTAKLSSSPYYYFYTSIQLKIPACHILSADSTKFTVMLRNPDNQVGSVFPYDVSLWLYGSKDTAHVQFLADLVQYTGLFVGNKSITGSDSLLYKFQDWTELTLEAKSNKLIVYKNGAYVLGINYRGQKIGRLQKIEIGFKGSGEADWVKLFNSNSGKQVMQEDFNTEGHSNIVWY